MKFTAVVVSLLAGSAVAAPTTDMNANKASDMSADVSPIANMRLADMFDQRQMAVLKVLSQHQQELGMSQEEKDMMDAFMAALHGEAAINIKRQATVPAAATAPAPAAVINTTALGSLGGVNSVVPTGVAGAVGTAASGVTNTAAGAPLSATDVLSILKGIPGLGALLANATGAVGGATSGLGSATSGLTGGLGGLTGGLGCSTGGLGGLTGGLGGLTGGLGGLLGGARRGGLLGGILIPGIL